MALRMSAERRHQLNLIAKLLPGRHTMTSVLEWALDVAMAKTTELSDVKKTWSPHDSDRFVLTATAYPQALTHDEQILWDFIKARREFFLRAPNPPPGGVSVSVQSANEPPPPPTPEELGFNYMLLRDTWEMITAHVVNGAPWDETAFLEICKKHNIGPSSPWFPHQTYDPKET